jgi:two-component system chemotaxis response regulator CheY
MRILIAEDDVTSRLLLRKALGGVADVELIEAEDGQEAWRLLTQGLVPDLCLIDHQMPRLSGLELLEKMRQDPRLRAVPVMICTSSSDRTTVARAAKLRIRDYLLKPVQPAAVLAKVEAFRKELVARQTLEDAATVRARLNLDEATYRQQLAALVRLLNASLAGICQALGQGLRGAAGLPITPLKQGCADFGASAMLTGLANLEGALHEAGAALALESWPPPAGWIEKLQPLLAALEHLRVQTDRLLETVGPLPPAPPPPPPPPPPPAPPAEAVAPDGPASAVPPEEPSLPAQ